ncbi:MAG: haloacid dehalogenase type II [Sphingomonadales bacterium]|nr:haloacid dehalogenase type II [Sphingomonadales bacterium]
MAQSASNRALPKALAFDVFGTVVDWRTSIAREVAPVLLRIGRSDVDCHDFADRWRARYLPALLASNKSESGFVKLDSLHRTMLDALLLELGVEENMLDDAARTDLVHAWHRLDPWPDSVAGLTRLKQRFPIVTLSNGNISLMINMARRAGLPWDAILGAEIAQAYKPARQAYLATAAALDIAPEELCLVAAHHGDLAAARSAGLMTAFIPRPLEYGGAPAPDLSYKQEWEFHADSLTGLADQLGC